MVRVVGVRVRVVGVGGKRSWEIGCVRSTVMRGK